MLALRDHPQVQASQLRAEAGVAAVGVARSGYYPRFDLRANAGAEWIDKRSSRRDSRYWYGPYGVGLRARQMLFDGRQTQNAVAAQSADARADSFETIELKELIALDIARVMSGLAANDEFGRYARENHAYLQHVLNQLDKGLKQGLVSIADVQLARERLQRARAFEAQIERARQELLASFEALVGRAYPKAVGQLPDLQRGLPESAAALFASAQRASPLLKKLQGRSEAAAARAAEATAGYYPRVDLEVASRFDENIEGRSGIDSSSEAWVVMQWNLGNGYRTSNERSRSVALAGARRLDVDRAARRIRQRLESGLGARAAMKRELAAITQQIETAQALRYSYEKKLSLREAQLFDLLQVQEDYFRAQTTGVDLRYSLILSGYQLLADAGLLLVRLDLQAERVTRVDGALRAEKAQKASAMALEGNGERVATRIQAIAEGVQPASIHSTRQPVLAPPTGVASIDYDIPARHIASSVPLLKPRDRINSADTPVKGNDIPLLKGLKVQPIPLVKPLSEGAEPDVALVSKRQTISGRAVGDKQAIYRLVKTRQISGTGRARAGATEALVLRMDEGRGDGYRLTKTQTADVLTHLKTTRGCALFHRASTKR